MPPIKTKELPQTPTVAPQAVANGIAEAVKPKRAKKAAASTTAEVEAPAEKRRTCIYPVVRAEICVGDNSIKVDDAKQILGWETEAEFQRRMMAQHPGTKADAWAYKDVYMLTDNEGSKVRCLNNLDNRPFDEQWCRGLAQSILRGQWAGCLTIPEVEEFVYGVLNPDGTYGGVPPVTIDGRVYNAGDVISLPKGTVNGSTMVVSRTGRMESGQHSGAALVLAWQTWWKDKAAYPFWADKVNAKGELTGPVIETILVTGVSEDYRVIMTVDNCKQRSEADVFYTSELFVKLREQPGKRREMSRMLAACVDLFWSRTDTKGYKTHAEVMGMIDRHPRLIKCIEHLFEQNAQAIYEHVDPATGDKSRQPERISDDDKIIGGRMISNLRLSPGQCAALCYVLGCSDSDGDAYRNGAPPREKGLDWSQWQQAQDFWRELGQSPGFKPVREALNRLVETDKDDPDNVGLGGRADEKLAILARAWAVYKDEGRQFTELDLEEGGCLHLRYSPPTNTVVTLDGGGTKEVYTAAALIDDLADFGGIDVPKDEKIKKQGQAPRAPTKEEREQEAERIRKEKAQETAEKIRQMRLSADGKPASPKQPVGPVTQPLQQKPQGVALKGGVG